MLDIKKTLSLLCLLIAVAFTNQSYAKETTHIPILCYHNFNPVKPGSMNLKPARFEEQLNWLKDNGFTIIPLQEAVDYLQGKRTSLPPKAVVITIDDGWKSVYTYVYPIIRKHKIPVTLFIYPQTISEGKNTLTWDELHELQNSGYFDVQSHTYSHPNFKIEKRHLSAASFDKNVEKELVQSKQILEEKMGKPITLLAWPFGIYNDYLEQQAAKAGYAMAFTIDYRTAKRADKPMAQPRFMILESQSMNTFKSIVNGALTD